MRCDSAGATHKFAQACRDRGVGFSFGFPVDARVWDAVDTLNLAEGWYPAIDSDGQIRDGAWVAEATTLVNLATWPARTRLLLRKERPHPGAQLRFTDIDGMRITAFITDTAHGAVPGQLAGLELCHRQHARVEDRIRQAKAAGLANLPCHDFQSNAAWLEIVLAAADLVAWAQLIGFTDTPELARAEIGTFRYRVLHVAARITRSARQLRLATFTVQRPRTPPARKIEANRPPTNVVRPKGCAPPGPCGAFWVYGKAASSAPMVARAQIHAAVARGIWAGMNGRWVNRWASYQVDV